MNDEQQIHDFLARWRSATLAGDVDALRAMCAEDALFLQPGQAPMRGAAAFADAFRIAIAQFSIDYSVQVEEVRILGDHASCWATLVVTATPRAGGDPRQRAGHTLTLFERRDGRWLLSRDANMLVAVPQV
ncbi:conserved hypothetical protein [Andreprevotia lacus DSM 23236]|uniref:DUF4440 domain-containing protein n=1 Tax=Andreprevotia lacus DSM 23236 TaxID=1121001 RepID=A0A1W1WXJ7_9NEIS|nr:nuclear transport factor 2 family protein [Andreprevotia lacus]SMC16148.1 conserved hypothetical protein [Andreprevotia lacus DSM 23236]